MTMSTNPLLRKPHKFQVVNKLDPAQANYKNIQGQVLWRCEDCDSEVIFPVAVGGRKIDYNYVNLAMSRKLACLVKEFFQKN